MLKRNAGSVFVIPWNSSAAKDGRTVDGSDLVHVRAVQQIERVEYQIEFLGLLEMDSARKAEVPAAQVIAKIRIPGNYGLAVAYRGASVGTCVAGEERRATHAIRCTPGQIVEGGIPGENSKRTPGLDGNDAAEREIPIPAGVRS